jgi:hypothetical protein
MSHHRGFIALAATCLALIGPSRGRADTFAVTVTNLNGTSLEATETVSVRAFKLNASLVSPDLSQVSINRGSEIGISPKSSRSKSGDLVLTFDILANDPTLTIGGTNPEKTVLLVFNRDDTDTAAVPFLVASNSRHSLSVAVPTAVQYRGMQPQPCYIDCCCPPSAEPYYIDCYCPPSEKHGFFGLFRRRCR